MVSLNEMLLHLSTALLLSQNEHNELAERRDWDDEYDFVVIGAGAAGSVVAARLSENPDFKVLLLEAGGAAAVKNDIPALALLHNGPEQTWNNSATPQRVQMAFKSNLLKRGKGMGGSSTINIMNYFRGHILDFDRWVSEFGLKNWSYNRVLKYFLRSQDMNSLPLVRRNSGRQSIGGPLTVSLSNVDAVNKRMLKMFHEIGYPIVDMSEQNGIGVSRMTKLLKNGRRCESEAAFLLPNRCRKNLHVLAYSTVTKLNFGENRFNKKLVKSVVFKRGNKFHSVTVRKEAILSAGVFGTPQLLMLSGVGPKHHLKQLNIRTIIDLPVGSNLQDHIDVNFILVSSKQSDKQSSDETNLNDIYDAFIKGTGPLTIVTPVTLNARTNATSQSELDPKWPDVEIRLLTGFDTFRTADQYKNEKIWSKYLSKCKQSSCHALSIANSRPKSIGNVKLRSSNPFDTPIIDPNYLSNDHDFQVLLAALKLVLRIFKSKQFKQTGLRWLGPIPGCKPCDAVSNDVECDEYLTCYILQIGNMLEHFVGSCHAGVDNSAPVRPDFLVRGTRNLRVIDSSVIPSYTYSLHMVSATMAIGEFGADQVMKSWN